MGRFDQLELNLDSANETVNFGTRALSSDGDNLYEASTKAIIRSSEDLEGCSPHINSFVKSGKLFLSVDDILYVFLDRQCSDLDFQNKYDTIIDSLCLSDEGKLLLCFRNGNICIIDCEQDFHTIFESSCKRDENEDCFFINTFIYEESFLIVNKLGQVFTLSNGLSLIHDFNFQVEISAFNAPFLVVNGERFAVYDFKSVSFMAGLPFKRIFPFKSCFFCLDLDGYVYKVCVSTRLISPVYDKNFQDLHILFDGSKYFITALVEESGKKFIQLLDQGFDKIFSLKVAQSSIHLVSQECINDEILYISKIGSAELRIHEVYETEPIQRLHRLLRKRNYEEAEIFARVHNLDQSLISRQKALEIVEKSVCTSEDIDSLIKQLDLIEDLEFRVSCCNDVDLSCESLEDLKKILSYGCSLPLKRNVGLQKMLMEKKFRLETFVALKRSSMLEWAEFSTCCPLAEVKKLLRDFEMEKASIIFSRFTQNLTVDEVSSITNILNNMPTAAYCSFLPSFITTSVSAIPATFSFFVLWTRIKALNFENNERERFPCNAISFTENMVSLMRGDPIDISFQRECIQSGKSLEELAKLLEALQRLKLLKEEFGIERPLEVFLQGPNDIVRDLLNIEMPPKRFSNLLKKFLLEFMVLNQMEPNQILLEEISSLMGYGRDYTNLVNLILQCITSIEVKLKAVVVILKQAAIPWNDVVKRIAQEYVKIEHPLVADIKQCMEDEPVRVVLNKPCYKIQEKYIADMIELRYMIGRILYYNEPSMIEDVYTLAKAPEYRHLANVLLISHLVQQGLYEEAMELLNDNTPEEILSCGYDLIRKIEDIVNGKVNHISEELQNHYYQVATSLFQCLHKHESDDLTKAINQETLNLIRNVYNAKKEFQITTTTQELRDPGKKKQIVNEFLDRTQARYEKGELTGDGLLPLCARFSNALSVNLNELLINLCEKCQDYVVVFKLANEVFASEAASSRHLCSMAVLLLKYLGICKMNLLDTSAAEDEADALDHDLLCKGLWLARHLAEKALYRAKDDGVELIRCSEVANWTRISLLLTSQDLGLFGDFYKCTDVQLGFHRFKVIRGVFVAFCQFLGSMKLPVDSYFTKFNTTTLDENGFLEELKLLELKSINNQGLHNTCYKLSATLYQSLTMLERPTSSITNFLDHVLNDHCISKVALSLLNNTNFDVVYFYNLFTPLAYQSVNDLLKKSMKMNRRNLKKFECLLRAAIWLNEQQNTPAKDGLKAMFFVLKWWKRKDQKPCDINHYFNLQPEQRFDYLDPDPNQIQEYCKDFHLDQQQAKKFFLRKILIKWKPDYEIRTKGDERYLVVKNSQDDLLKDCQGVMDGLDAAHVNNILTTIWPTINPYYYEVFLVILCLKEQIGSVQHDSKEKFVLNFLKNYKRVGKPSEMDEDPLAEFRLIFTPVLFTKKVFNVIRSEINLKTYRSWFAIVGPLKPFVDEDYICSFVVKQIVASSVFAEEEPKEWVMCAKHVDLLAEIEECVSYISNLEVATSALHLLMRSIPHGADQVNAAKLCYQYALKYQAQSPKSTTVEESVRKIKHQYFTHCATHILHRYQLYEKNYTDLLTQPNDLLLALYLDKRISGNSVDLYCPNINKAAEELATLFDLDIQKTRLGLVDKWLGLNAESEDFVVSHTEENSEDFLNRVAYICSSGNLDYWQSYLFNIGMGANDADIAVHCQVRALKVFSIISDEKAILHWTKATYAELRNYVEDLNMVGNLKNLGISMDVEAWQQRNKREILNMLAQYGCHAPVIKTMALICVNNELYIAKCWEFILNNTIKLCLFSELKTYLKFLKEVSFYNKSFFINAWQHLINHSFASGDNLFDSFLLLQSCPVLCSLSFDKAFRCCINQGRFEFAAVLLQYFDANKSEEYVRKIPQSEDLVASLNNLAVKGLWGISHVLEILQVQD